MEAVRIFLAYVTHKNFTMYQIDVKSVVLNGLLEEEAYIEQLPRFDVQNNGDKVYKLKKYLVWTKTNAKSGRMTITYAVAVS